MGTLKFKLLSDRVAIKRVEVQEKTAGGLYVPPAAAEKPTEGEVVGVGSGKILPNGKFVETTLKVGDRVLFGKYSGTEIKIGDEDVVIMREEDILGVITK